MKGTCAAPVASEGPTCLNCPPSSAAAICPPVAAVSKYGLFTAFGRKATLSAPCADAAGTIVVRANANAAAQPYARVDTCCILICVPPLGSCQGQAVSHRRRTINKRGYRAASSSGLGADGT